MTIQARIVLNAPQDHLLIPLENACWKLTLALHSCKVPRVQSSLSQWPAQEIGRNNGILHSKINAKTANGCHDMSRIAYEEQARTIPTDQAAGLYRKQRDLFPIGN